MGKQSTQHASHAPQPTTRLPDARTPQLRTGLSIMHGSMHTPVSDLAFMADRVSRLFSSRSVAKEFRKNPEQTHWIMLATTPAALVRLPCSTLKGAQFAAC